jgi:hypothetical protein
MVFEIVCFGLFTSAREAAAMYPYSPLQILSEI